MTGIRLRDVAESDLPALFDHFRDPDAVHMAAFTAKDPTDRAAFTARWARLLADPTVVKMAILLDGRLVGSLLSFESSGQRQVAYWIQRDHWGKGIATAALKEFLRISKARPLVGRAAADNVGSIRVLEKCGFKITRRERGFANARGEEIEEVVLVLGARETR